MVTELFFNQKIIIPQQMKFAERVYWNHPVYVFLSVDKNLSGLSLETTRGIYLKFSTYVNYHIKLITI